MKRNVMKSSMVFLLCAICSITACFAEGHEEHYHENEGTKLSQLLGAGTVGIPSNRFADFELGFTFASAYIWRGQNFGTDASWQPYVTVSPKCIPEGFGDISFTCWANVTKNNPGENHNETDFSIDYELDIEEYGSFSAGYIYYDFPHVEDDDADESQEIYFGVALPVLLNPSFTWYHDFDAGSGEWLEFGLSHDFDVIGVSVSTYATLSYVDGQWGAGSGFSTLDFGASLPIPLGMHMTIEPYVSYTKRLEDTYSGGVNLIHDELYGGFNWSITFYKGGYDYETDNSNDTTT